MQGNASVPELFVIIVAPLVGEMYDLIINPKSCFVNRVEEKKLKENKPQYIVVNSKNS